MGSFRSSLVKAAAVLLFSVLPLNAPVHAQDSPPPGEAPPNGGMVLFYLDCDARGGCDDEEFLKTEIQFVNWVREPQDADVYLLITSQTTGAGGQSYDLFFMGQGRFESMADTLKYVGGYDATEDESRRGLASIIKIGLMQFVGLTPIAPDIVIGLREEEAGRTGRGPVMATQEDDPWNFWVFRASISGYGMGESTFKAANISGSITASRTTEEWKTSLRVRTSYSEDRLSYDDLEELTVTRGHSLTGLQVKSLTDHWSLGLRGGISSSTYSNIRLNVEAAPVLEYNVFPYSESTRRSLTFQYALEGAHVEYVEETVYFQTAENIFSQSLGVRLDMTQPWGSSNIYGSAGHFLTDIKRHNAGIGGGVEVRVARGFSVRLSGSFSRIQDRVSVAAGEATIEDVLLRRKQLQTDYYYFCSFSLSYTFGSIFNNIVNPRIGGG